MDEDIVISVNTDPVDIVISVLDQDEDIQVIVTETDRASLGLAITDSPEFADTQITTLNSDASGGVIPAAQFSWLGATAKSVLSFISAIVNYIYSIKDIIIFATPRTGITLTGAILLDRAFTQYNSYTMSGALELSVSPTYPVVGGFAEGIIVGNGTNTPTLNGITLWPTSASFDPTNLKQNKFMVLKFGGAVYINWTQLN
jgi:hypothetical protein